LSEEPRTKLQVTAGDIADLLDVAGWANDEVVNLYLALTAAHFSNQTGGARVHAASSFFYARLTGGPGGYDYAAVRRWTKAVDVFACDLIVVPINSGNTHWTLVAIRPGARRVEYYDSLPGSRARVTRVFIHIMTYLRDEHLDKRGTSLELGKRPWTAVWAKDGVPLQEDGSACAVFTITNAAVLAAQAAAAAKSPYRQPPQRVFPYTQAHITALRARIAVDCLLQRHTPLWG
jgi:sentrin-specific protease 1